MDTRNFSPAYYSCAHSPAYNRPADYGSADYYRSAYCCAHSSAYCCAHASAYSSAYNRSAYSSAYNRSAYSSTHSSAYSSAYCTAYACSHGCSHGCSRRASLTNNAAPCSYRTSSFGLFVYGRADLSRISGLEESRQHH